MSFSGTGTIAGSRRAAGADKSRSSARKAYDSLAGSEVLRRTGKAAFANDVRRGDPAAAILAARRRNDVEDRIDAQLRGYYQAVTREPIPERILALLDRLEAGAEG